MYMTRDFYCGSCVCLRLCVGLPFFDLLGDHRILTSLQANITLAFSLRSFGIFCYCAYVCDKYVCNTHTHIYDQVFGFVNHISNIPKTFYVKTYNGYRRVSGRLHSNEFGFSLNNSANDSSVKTRISLSTYEKNEHGLAEAVKLIPY